MSSDDTTTRRLTSPKISVVTPTLGRPQEVRELLHNLSQQVILPFELILVDGAPAEVTTTEETVAELMAALPFRCHYLRQEGGTAIQRNAGIDRAAGDFIAFIDDDIRLEPDFLKIIIDAFKNDAAGEVGGIAGYITDRHLDPHASPRWQWYRRLRLFTTYEPGRYDFETGYPINRYLQPPHQELKEIDFMGAGCAVWRRQVLDSGLRFSIFFVGFGVLEDAHFALRAGRRWKLLECGQAHCLHLKSPHGRVNNRKIARMSATNYRFVFIDIVRQRTWNQEFRFWRVQFFDLFRFLVHAFRFGGRESWLTVLGKLEGLALAWRISPEQTGESI